MHSNHSNIATQHGVYGDISAHSYTFIFYGVFVIMQNLLEKALIMQGGHYLKWV